MADARLTCGQPASQTQFPQVIPKREDSLTRGYTLNPGLLGEFRGPMLDGRCAATSSAPSGHLEQLPSGWWRAKVYGLGRHRSRAAGQYVPIAGWDVSTEGTNFGYIRRAITPVLGS